MFSNYFKTAFRNLLRNRNHFFVNITGLVVGFSAFLLIFLVLTYEQSFDNFHAKKDRIYRVVRQGKDRDDRGYRTGVPFPVTNGLRTEYPQIENAAAICIDYGVQVIVPGAAGEPLKKFKEANGVFFAEPQFFNLFDFKITEGRAVNSASDHNTALLTKQTAEKYFGDWKTAIGKVIKAYGVNIRITGIIDNPPVNTDFPLSIVLPYGLLNPDMSDWASITDNNYCFVLLRPGYSAAQLNAMLPAFITRHIAAEYAGYNFILQPLEEMHFDSRLGNFSGHTFNRDLITALTLIGLFLLIIACVNFINLSTANAVNRAREVGVRKVLGSSRRQLLLQFFGETGITCLLAMLGALMVATVTLPFLNSLLETHLSMGLLQKPAVIAFILGAWLAVTLLSGFYPALVLSGFNPINALKSKITGETGKGINLRRILVVLQFVIAQVLITGTLVVVSQMNYFTHADMGFNKEAIVSATFPQDSVSRLKVDVLRSQLLNLPGIRNVSLSTFTPLEGGGWATDLLLASNHTKRADLIVNMKPADTSYFSIYQLQLAAGRVYFPSDSLREFVVNETLVKQLNLGSPQQAIGKQITVLGKTCPIVGVVKDFHQHSLRDPIDPMVMIPYKSNYRTANIQIAPGKTKETLAAIAGIWNNLFPDYVFEYNFFDKSIAYFYKQENQLLRLYTIFAGIAIFISCLGLYGLVSFMAVRRRKEIGIRKVLGAPVSNILLLLSREFTLLIAIAFFIAAPIAWYCMHQWLQQYYFRINLGIGFFVVTLLCAVLIAWLTVGHSAIKAAIANPVKSLRTE